MTKLVDRALEYREASTAGHYFLSWRRAMFAGHLAIVWAVASLSLRELDAHPAIAALVLFCGATISYALAFAALRTRAIYSEAGAVMRDIEQGKIKEGESALLQTRLDNTRGYGPRPYGLHTNVELFFYVLFCWLFCACGIVIMCTRA